MTLIDDEADESGDETHGEEDESDTETAYDREFLDDTNSDLDADLHRRVDIEREHAAVADARDSLKRLRREENTRKQQKASGNDEVPTPKDATYSKRFGSVAASVREKVIYN